MCRSDHVGDCSALSRRAWLGTAGLPGSARAEQTTLDTAAWLTYLDATSIEDVGASAIERIDPRVTRYRLGSGVLLRAGPMPDPCDSTQRGEAYALRESRQRRDRPDPNHQVVSERMGYPCGHRAREPRAYPAGRLSVRPIRRPRSARGLPAPVRAGASFELPATVARLTHPLQLSIRCSRLCERLAVGHRERILGRLCRGPGRARVCGSGGV